jgi:hypothetical protein
MESDTRRGRIDGSSAGGKKNRKNSFKIRISKRNKVGETRMESEVKGAQMDEKRGREAEAEWGKSRFERRFPSRFLSLIASRMTGFRP